MQRIASFTALLLCWLMLGIACQSCQNATTSAPGAVDNSKPAWYGQLPELPQTATGAQRVASDYTFQPADVYEMVGGSWDGSVVSLQAAGFSYAILRAQAGGQQVDAISLAGSANNLWLGVGDYSRRTWRWLAGPLDSGGEHPLPEMRAVNKYGEMYIALVCPDSAECSVAVTLKITEPESVITLGASMPGAKIKPLLGVNAGPYPAGDDPLNVDLTAQYEALGVKYVRTHDFYGPLDLAEMYPDRSADPALESSYNFTQSDIRWQAIRDSGAEPYFRLGDSYNNSTPPANATERQNMVQAAVEIFQHYRNGKWGGFTASFTYIEIWNEPDNATFWPGHTRMEFFEYFRDTAKALKEVSPADMKIGGPGFVVAAYLAVPDGQQYVKDFLSYMSTNSVPLDFVSWHIYSNIPAVYAGAAAWYREQLDAYGYTSAESHITEYNTSDKDLLPGELQDLRTGARGAAVLSAAWIALQQGPVDQAMFYRGNDTSNNLETFYGLYRAYGEPKKIAHAFALWHILYDHPARYGAVATLAGGGASPLWVISGATFQAQEVLVANPYPTATTLSLAFSDGSFPSNHYMTVREVSAGSDGEEVGCDGTVMPIAAYGVQLIEVQPSLP